MACSFGVLSKIGTGQMKKLQWRREIGADNRSFSTWKWETFLHFQLFALVLLLSSLFYCNGAMTIVRYTENSLRPSLIAAAGKEKTFWLLLSSILLPKSSISSLSSNILKTDFCSAIRALHFSFEVAPIWARRLFALKCHEFQIVWLLCLNALAIKFRLVCLVDGCRWLRVGRWLWSSKVEDWGYECIRRCLHSLTFWVHLFGALGKLS